MENKLTLEHLAPYFPYGIELAFVLRDEIRYVGKITCIYDMQEYDDIKIKIGYNDAERIWMFKPILRTLSDLTKEIEHNGERFVSIDFLKSISEVPYSESFRFEDGNFMFTTQIMDSSYGNHQWLDYDFCCSNQYEMYKKLFEWHFDVFGLIDAGLAFDINTLDNDQNIR
jgi:hypothetical protein